MGPREDKEKPKLQQTTNGVFKANKVPQPLRKPSKKQIAVLPGALKAEFLFKAAKTVAQSAPSLASHLGQAALKVVFHFPVRILWVP